MKDIIAPCTLRAVRLAGQSKKRSGASSGSPDNGGILYAAALMAAGWDGVPGCMYPISLTRFIDGTFRRFLTGSLKP